MSIKDGGPAFPCEWDNMYSCREVANGMTLRDYFAAKAMEASLVATMNATGGDIEKVVRNSYAIADWMLKAREEE